MSEGKSARSLFCVSRVAVVSRCLAWGVECLVRGLVVL